MSNHGHRELVQFTEQLEYSRTSLDDRFAELPVRVMGRIFIAKLLIRLKERLRRLLPC